MQSLPYRTALPVLAATLAAALVAPLLLTACAAPAAAPQTAAVLPPPPALTMSDVPAVPASLPARVGRYTEFRGAGLADMTPDGQRLLVVWRAGPPTAERAQLHIASAPGQPLRA